MQKRNSKYKQREVIKEREVNFEVADMVLAHLRKETFPKMEYKMLKFKKTRPCRIVKKFLANPYKIELPEGVSISPIFNVEDLYKYKEGETIDEVDSGYDAI